MLRIVLTLILVVIAVVAALVLLAARMDPTANFNREGNWAIVIIAACVAILVWLWTSH